MKALVYLTSRGETSMHAPLLEAERVDIEDRSDEYAWMVEVESVRDLCEIMAESGHSVVVRKPTSHDDYGQDIDIEIYDDYRE